VAAGQVVVLEALFASARHPADRAGAEKGVPERWWLPIVFTGLLVGLLGLAWFVFTLPGWSAVAERLS